MPKITCIEDYNGVSSKISRLNLQNIDTQIKSSLDFELLVAEERHANGTKGIREKIDSKFELFGGWKQQKTGGIDWSFKNVNNISVGVEVQVSGRSDLLAVDVLHLKDSLSSGIIDVGYIIVPDDNISKFLTDRTPNFRTAKKHIESRAADMPIRLIGFRHDGVGPPLKKMRTNLGKN